MNEAAEPPITDQASRTIRVVKAVRDRDTAVSGQFRINYEETLNPEQYQAVTTIDGPVLVIAGAGSGKTRVITYRVAYLVEKGIPPERIVLLTFTRRAAAQMLSRAQGLTGLECTKVQGGTFHSFAHLMLRRYSEQAGLSPNFVVLDEGDSEDAVKLVRDQLGLGQSDRRFPNKRTVFDIISSAHNKQISLAAVVLADYPQFEEEITALQRISDGYRDLKRERQLVDFDDLLELLRDLLAGPLGRQISARYLHVMADEYQDTNRVQADIVRLLAQEHRNVCVVGDDAQCIYTWRGADSENILRFSEQFPETRLIKLERNYRSTQQVLDLANAVMAKACRTYTKVLRATRDGGDLPWLLTFPNPTEQAEFIAAKILELREEGVGLSDIAVLTRAVWHLRELELELSRRNIPYVVYGGIRFSEAAHIKDVLAYLRVAVNSADALSLKRVVELIPRIGSRTSQRLIEQMTGSFAPWDTLEQLSAQLKLPGESAQTLFNLAQLFRQLASGSFSPARCIEEARNFYRPTLRAQFDDYPRRESDLEQLIGMAGTYKSLQRLLTDMALEPNRDRSQERMLPRDPEDELLVLSTVHSAKGLEFHSVFIPHLMDGLFPSIRSFGDEASMEEERRLFYVAVTRAKVGLFLSAPLFLPNRGWQQQELGMATHSRFLDNAVRDYLEQVDVEWE